VTRAASLGRAAALAALLAAGAAHGGEGGANAQGTVREPVATPAAAPERPRVAPGVLVRATSRRAQKRQGSAPREATDAGAPAADGMIESIEIDWNGSGTTP
jgi:hypothetical protein